MMWDRDTYALERAAYYSHRARRESWQERHAARQRKAWENGIFDHTPDHAAPFGTLARYGYLLSLTDGPVARAFEEYKRRVGVPQHAAVSDKQRYAFENEYIAIAREKAAARKLIRFPGGQGGKEKPRAR